MSRPKRGRSKIRVSPYVQVSAPTTRNIAVFVDMNKYGMFYHKIHNAFINVKDFKQCIIGLSAVCYSRQIENPIFILDNARIHHYNGLNKMIKNLNLNFFFLLTYSAFLNQIKNIFSK